MTNFTKRQALWEQNAPDSVMVLTPAGMRALENNLVLTDRCEELIAERDSLRAEVARLTGQMLEAFDARDALRANYAASARACGDYTETIASLRAQVGALEKELGACYELLGIVKGDS